MKYEYKMVSFCFYIADLKTVPYIQNIKHTICINNNVPTHLLLLVIMYF